MKSKLLSTVALSAIILMAGTAAHAADPNVDANGSSQSIVQGSQTMTSNITGSAVTENSLPKGDGDTDSAFRTGDVKYQATTTVAPGIFTLQNQTGLNNAGNNGANIGAQLNNDAAGTNILMSGTAINAVNALQGMTANITNSPVTVTSITTDEVMGLNRTGDIKYDGDTFSGLGLYTIQNQTGMNNAGNNGTNMAFQINLTAPAAIDLEDGAINQVVSSQTMNATIDPSNVTITNLSNVDDLPIEPNRTGDVTYSQSTFDAAGLYTLQNNTGLNNAANNATGLAVQYNNGASDSIDLDDASKNLVLATQVMSSTISNSNVLVTNQVDATVPSRTGDVTYADTTFNAPGLFTISNNTGMNNAANNAFSLAVQVNGGI